MVCHVYGFCRDEKGRQYDSLDWGQYEKGEEKTLERCAQECSARPWCRGFEYSDSGASKATGYCRLVFSDGEAPARNEIFKVRWDDGDEEERACEEDIKKMGSVRNRRICWSVGQLCAEECKPARVRPGPSGHAQMEPAIVRSWGGGFPG